MPPKKKAAGQELSNPGSTLQEELTAKTFLALQKGDRCCRLSAKSETWPALQSGRWRRKVATHIEQL
jgi:hypothetical protein